MQEVSWMKGAGNKRSHDPQRAGKEYLLVVAATVNGSNSAGKS